RLFGPSPFICHATAPSEIYTLSLHDALPIFWAQSDFVIRGTLIVLVIMSFGSWYIIFTKLWDQRRLRKSYKEMEKNFWTAGNLRDGIQKLTGKDNAYRMIAEDGIRAAQHHEGRLTDQVPLHEWVGAALYRSVESVS